MFRCAGADTQKPPAIRGLLGVTGSVASKIGISCDGSPRTKPGITPSDRGRIWQVPERIKSIRARKGARLSYQKTGKTGGGGAALGINAKSVDQTGAEKLRRAVRIERFQLQRTAAALLPGERVGKCRWLVQSRAAGVEVMQIEGRAFYAGLQTCGSVWACPCCGAKISEVRRGELNALLAWARERELVPVMLTLTASHAADDDLAAQLAAMKAAKRRLRQRREWRALKSQIAGTVTATEVTHGANGWHTHFHEIILMRSASEAAALARLGLGRVWLSCLRGVGLDGTERRAWQAQGAQAAGSYIGKWGAAEELALTGAKKGRGGRTPLQLLALARAGDERAAALWQEYATAFKGARQLVWSPGLKAAAGIEDTPDEDAAEGDADADSVAVIDAATWSGWDGWRGARHRRGRVLDAAEDEGAAGVWRVSHDGGGDPEPDPEMDLIEDMEGEGGG